MSLELWLIFLVVSIAPVISPGPGILFSITNALRYGPKTTILIGCVNAFGILVVALAVGLGLGALMAASAFAYLALKLAGGAYLVWLGIRIWRDRSAFLVDPGKPSSKPPIRALTVQALAISLTNPKAIVALAALLPPFLNADAPLAPQVWILATTYAVLCAANHVLIAYAGGWLRRFLKAPHRVRAVKRVTGGTFIGFGLALVASGRP
ncbi:MAG: LysE family translocator [Pseudomonadota bacterium]